MWMIYDHINCFQRVLQAFLVEDGKWDFGPIPMGKSSCYVQKQRLQKATKDPKVLFYQPA